MARKAALVTIGRAPFACMYCRGDQFFDREIKLNTSGMEFFDLGWANQSATGLVCAGCGYVHTFLNRSIEFWKPENGYPVG